MDKSKEFDNILNECLERLLARGETAEQCLRSYPEYTDKLKPLLETALSVNRMSAIQPSEEFRERARHQFRSALKEAELRKSRPFIGWLWQPRWAVTVAIALLLAAGGGTVAASGDSMPDEPLYSVKLITEDVEIFFTRSKVGRAQLYAELADKRVAEIVVMADENRPDKVDEAAGRLESYLTEIVDLASGEQAADGMLMGPAMEEAAAPESEVAPPPAEEEEVPAETPATREPQPPSAVDMGEPAKWAGLQSDPLGTLKATVTLNAIDHVARLRAALEEVPASARPALRRALAISEAGYDRILESLY